VAVLAQADESDVDGGGVQRRGLAEALGVGIGRVAAQVLNSAGGGEIGELLCPRTRP
jgi:hypothetical protein